MNVTLDFAEICRTLPHGHPMVLLDRVVALEPGASIHAIKTVSGSEPCYAGLGRALAADRYAYPASLLLESFGQAAAVLWLRSATDRPSGSGSDVLMFAAARDCEFTGSAFPGDVLRHVARLEHVTAGAAFMSGHTLVGRRRIASYGSILAVVRPRARLPGHAASHAQADPHETGAETDG